MTIARTIGLFSTMASSHPIMPTLVDMAGFETATTVAFWFSASCCSVAFAMTRLKTVGPSGSVSAGIVCRQNLRGWSLRPVTCPLHKLQHHDDEQTGKARQSALFSPGPVHTGYIHSGPERDILPSPVRFILRIIQPDQTLVRGILDNTRSHRIILVVNPQPLPESCVCHIIPAYPSQAAMLVAGPDLIRSSHFADVLISKQCNTHEIIIIKKFWCG